jgi:nucleoside-diphosphate-sugar epimerase
LLWHAGQILQQDAGREQTTAYGNGEQGLEFTYISNLVHGNLLAAAAPAEKISGQVMNVARASVFR